LANFRGFGDEVGDKSGVDYLVGVVAEQFGVDKERLAALATKYRPN